MPLRSHSDYSIRQPGGARATPLPLGFFRVSSLMFSSRIFAAIPCFQLIYAFSFPLTPPAQQQPHALLQPDTLTPAARERRHAASAARLPPPFDKSTPAADAA
jgi:hypothetical protein